MGRPREVMRYYCSQELANHRAKIICFTLFGGMIVMGPGVCLFTYLIGVETTFNWWVFLISIPIGIFLLYKAFIGWKDWDNEDAFPSKDG